MAFCCYENMGEGGTATCSVLRIGSHNNNQQWKWFSQWNNHYY